MKDLTTDLMEAPDGGGEQAPDDGDQRRLGGGTRMALLIAGLVVAVGAVGLLGYVVLDRLTDEEAPDYDGPGATPEVIAQVEEGETLAEVGQTLVDLDVVLSVEAFSDAAQRNPDSSSLQVGFYSMLQQMKASDALDRMLDPQYRVEAGVTVPEGFTVDQVFDRASEVTGIPRADFDAVEQNYLELPLPGWDTAPPDNRLEGFLFPATYPTNPGSTAESLVTEMIEKFDEVTEEMQFAQQAPANDMTPYEALIVASIAEREAGVPEDLGKVARVIYNRLEEGMPLQMDSTVNYALGKSDIRLSDQDVAIDSPYNTYKVTGLPPTPISNPGQAALEAAINPPEGDWLYFVLCDTDGSSCFSADYDQFLEDKQRAQDEGIY